MNRETKKIVPVNTFSLRKSTKPYIILITSFDPQVKPLTSSFHNHPYKYPNTHLRVLHNNIHQREIENLEREEMVSHFLGLPTSGFLLSMIVGVILLLKVVFTCWIVPCKAYHKLRKNGFGGPTPSFPFGNITEMKRLKGVSSFSSSVISHNIHSAVFPFFAVWQKLHGKVFVYWLGTEPFLYIANPEFLKAMSSGVLGKSWGKPNVFKNDRKPMFGNGLVMVEGEEWVRHRHIINPAFSPSNLKAMSSLMVDSTKNMLDRWDVLIGSGKPEIDVENEIINTAGEIIAKTSFGLSYENGKLVFEKLRAMQVTLFKSSRYVGVPFSDFLMCPKRTLESRRLGKDIDALLLSIILARKESLDQGPQTDLLGLLLAGDRALTTRELVDECKTFFFGGHETTALAITWTMLLLAMHPEWQNQLREEIREVVADVNDLDALKLSGLKKMGWVMNEVLRLYSPAPNVQRQIRQDLKVGNVVIPSGTNVWIDVVSLHHDRALWGDDVNEFRPERFKEDGLYGGCNHKMGFLPFGFGGSMCVGRNLTLMEYKIVLTLILTRFSLSVSPRYRHSPSIMLSLRPSEGLPIIVQPL